MVIVSEYDLPDIQLMHEETNKFLLWIPEKTYIILGASNKADDAVVLDSTSMTVEEVQQAILDVVQERVEKLW